jgi:hypothetical protein
MKQDACGRNKVAAAPSGSNTWRQGMSSRKQSLGLCLVLCLVHHTEVAAMILATTEMIADQMGVMM